jgi:S1-C subfamily serine protease
MPKPTSDGQTNDPQPPSWQSWMARLAPILYVTAISLSLPAIVSYRLPHQIGEFGQQTAETGQQQMRSIAVAVLAARQPIGSGILFRKYDRAYLVVTNAHVIQSGQAPFQVRTPDGRIYTAAYLPPVATHNQDLAVLSFTTSERTYTTATIATEPPQIGDRVWVAGFPLARPQPDRHTDAWGLKIGKGNIANILPKPLAGGYTIGSDAPIEKGMSGGPLFNDRGEVVGINGVHADPLWEGEDNFADGSKVGQKLQTQIDNSSWAIAIANVTNYLPQPKPKFD